MQLVNVVTFAVTGKSITVSESVGHLMCLVL